MGSDIRKWFMKQHDKSNGAASSGGKPSLPVKNLQNPTEDQKQDDRKRRKTSKYFSALSEDSEAEKTVSKRKSLPLEMDSGEDDDFVAPSKKKTPVEPYSGKKLKVEEVSDKDKEEMSRKVAKKTPPKPKSTKILKMEEESDEDVESTGKVVKKSAVKPRSAKKSVVKEGSDEDEEEFGGKVAKKVPSKPKSAMKVRSKEESGEDEEEIGGKASSSQSKGRGRGSFGRGSAAVSQAGRGRGFGRGGFMNFGERKDPPHKGEKEVPEGAPDCLVGLTFVISGTLDSLEREEAEDLIKRHGGRVTGSVSKKTSFLLADEDIGGRKSAKAKELGTSFLTEDGLLEMIRKSKPAKTLVQGESLKRSPKSLMKTQPKQSPTKFGAGDGQSIKPASKVGVKSSVPSTSPVRRKVKASDGTQVTWTEKYKPTVPNDIVGNQSLVKQLHDWLAQWDEHFLHTSQKGKGSKKSDAGSKKAVLLSGSPGIGKTTSAKLVSKMLGFQAIEVNASDNRGKADAKIFKGIGGCMANSVKELVSNEALALGKDRSKHHKTVLIMDEVDGMSAGDRGGVSDLIASIKVSKIPIICICNDRYSQKLKSLVNHCLLLNFRKPTKQQMAKRLSQIALAEGIQANDIALEELADRVNGDMRMAINQLQYMSLSHSVINYDDVRARLLNSAKDEDISPFAAVDKLFGFNGGKLRMDERIDLSMSDPDLVPLIIQENYLNYRPIATGKDDNGVKRMNNLARTAESIGDGDIINVQIRRYRQWQLSQSGSVASCIIPAALMHGHRETLEQGERNYNRFGGWLGKNSTKGKNLRLLQDVHVHVLASQQSTLDREALRVDYFPLLSTQLTNPLRVMPKDKAVQNVVELMDCYSLNLEDYDSIIELSKFQGHPSPLEGVPAAVKAALTRAYKEGGDRRVIRSADMIALPGIKKPLKKRVAAMLEPASEGAVDLAELGGEEELTSEPEDEDGDGEDGEVSKLREDLKSNKSRGIEVDLELKVGSGPDKPSSKRGSRGGGSAAKPSGGRGTRGGKRK